MRVWPLCILTFAMVQAASAATDPTKTTCEPGSFNPGPFPRKLLELVITYAAGDPERERVDNLVVRCVGTTFDTVDFCATATFSAPNFRGELKRLVSGRARPFAAPIPELIEFASGAAADARCADLIGR